MFKGSDMVNNLTVWKKRKEPAYKGYSEKKKHGSRDIGNIVTILSGLFKECLEFISGAT